MIAPSPEQAAKADYGAYPKDAKAIVLAYIKSTYKDPYSIQDLQVGTPQRQFIQAPPLLGGGTTYGYLIAFSVNAKNSFGAYTGVQNHRLLVRNEQVVLNLDEQLMAN